MASAEKSASKATKEAQSSKKIVCASISVQLAVDQVALSTEIQFRLEFPVASKLVKLVLFPFLTSKLINELFLQLKSVNNVLALKSKLVIWLLLHCNWSKAVLLLTSRLVS